MKDYSLEGKRIAVHCWTNTQGAYSIIGKYLSEGANFIRIISDDNKVVLIPISYIVQAVEL